MPLAPPGRTRLLGRSRRYTAANLSARLEHWHAPRANRWECLYVMAGMVETEWLAAAEVTTLRMTAGEQRWIAPGTRWRIARMDVDAGFELEVRADETVAAAAPQGVRAALLDEVDVIAAQAADELAHVLTQLATGKPRLLRAACDGAAQVQAAMQNANALYWHPLEAGPDRCVALLVRATQRPGLADYMGRDHAVIESALAGALRGSAERLRWLNHSLARHLAIEETLLFPAYLDAGGRSGWIQGLLNEHQQLRHYLPQLDNATARRRFLLLLDGHDEKEEQLVYPDILQRVATQGVALARAAMCYPANPVLA